MNGLTTGTGSGGTSTSLRIITIVVFAIAINATIGVVTLSACMVMGTKPDPTLITAYVGLVGLLVGALTGLLVNTRTQSAPTNGSPLPVTVENKADERIPVDVTKPAPPKPPPLAGRGL